MRKNTKERTGVANDIHIHLMSVTGFCPLYETNVYIQYTVCVCIYIYIYIYFVDLLCYSEFHDRFIA